jgi:hypothetical protein
VTESVDDRSHITYFNNPLIEETFTHLPAALNYPQVSEFHAYLVEHLHQNSLITRRRMARYIVNRFSANGVMNVYLVRALNKYGDSQIGREILYFEYMQSIPILREIAVQWLAELSELSGTRENLNRFLEERLGERCIREVAKGAVQTFKKLGKMGSPKLAHYYPIWSTPPLEAFLYVLARLYPERTMVRVELFLNDNIVRAMLWPQSGITDLLKNAEAAGHISKISHLDQYYQFTLAGTGDERMKALLEGKPKAGNDKDNAVGKSKSSEGATRQRKQLSLFPANGENSIAIKEE